MTARRTLLDEVEAAVERVTQAVQETENQECLSGGPWSARDTLGHIAFWHESFARNVRALTEGRQPDVLEGSYPDLNRTGVERSRAMGLGQIAGRLRRAQGVIRRDIMTLATDTPIPYREGSRDYTPDEHLRIVREHILAHLNQIQRAGRRPRLSKQNRRF